MTPMLAKKEIISVKTAGWFLALVLVFWVTGTGGIISGRDAGSGVIELTLEEARNMVGENNMALQSARLSVERGNLAVEGLEETMAGVENRREELTGYLAEQEEERERLNLEIEELEQREEMLRQEHARLTDEMDEADSLEEYRRIALELQQVQRELAEVELELLSLRNQLGLVEAAIRGAEIALDGLDASYSELERQKQELTRALESAEELLQIQEEAVLFEVESMYAGVLILYEQEKLHGESHGYLNKLLSRETIKKEAGYSTPLQVEELKGRLRESERTADQLERKRLEIIDRLCLSVGLSPGTEVILHPFTPASPVHVSLDHALSDALNAGYLLQRRHERLGNREQELREIEDEHGEDSLRYRMALLDFQQAELELRQAEGETRAEVRHAYFAMQEAEREIKRSEAEVEAGKIQDRAVKALLDGGYITAHEAAAASLDINAKKAALVSARYAYHLAFKKFDLARQGYILPSSMGQVSGFLN